MSISILLSRLIWCKKGAILCSSGLLILNWKLERRRRRIFCDEVRPIEILKISTPDFDDLRGSRKVILEIIDILKKHLILTFAATGTAVLSAIMSIFSPIYVSRIIDNISGALQSTINSSGLIHNASILVGISFANALFSALYIKLIGDLGERIAVDLRRDLFENLLHESVSFFDDQQVGDLLTKLTVDVQNFKHSLKQILTTGIKAGVQLSASTVQMFLLSQSLIASLGASLPLFFVVGNVYGRFLRHLSADVKNSESVATNRAHEALINIRTVKAFGAEEFELQKYTHAIEDQEAKQSKLFGHIGLFQGLTHFSMNSLLAVVLYLGGMEVISGKLSNGGLLSFLISLQTAQKSLAQFVTLNAKWYSMLNDHERITKCIRKKDASDDGDLLEKVVNGRIEIKNLTFSYPDRTDKKIFNEANLIIEPNEVVGIVGNSGDGKSTLIHLLERFYEPENGQILIDASDVRDLNLKYLRKQIGIVPQEPVLFDGTISENITYGCCNNEYSAESIQEAAEKAHIHDFIKNLPQGYDTHISKCSLSGGQKQRIAIARTLLRDPKILILDEATSALDQTSEGVIHESLREIIKDGKTVIIITHKKDILKLAKRVYSLKDGNFIQL